MSDLEEIPRSPSHTKSEDTSATNHLLHDESSTACYEHMESAYKEHGHNHSHDHAHVYYLHRCSTKIHYPEG